MQKACFIILYLFLFAGQTVRAQSDSRLHELHKFVNHWFGISSVYLDEDVYEKSLFSADTVRTFYATNIFFDSIGMPVAQREHAKNEGFEQVSLYDGHRKYYLKSNNSYDLAKDSALFYRFGGNLFAKGGIIHTLKSYLQNQPQQVKLLPDTLIDGVRCKYVKMIKADSIDHEGDSYEHTYLAFDSQSYHPRYSKTEMKVELSKEGISLGTVDVFTTTTYLNIVKNGDHYDRNNFIPPKEYVLSVDVPQELLKKGTHNPEWTASASDGTIYNSSSFRGRTTLLFLTVIDCPANQLSLHAIENLQRRFDKDKLQIVAVYSDKPERVQKYVKTNNVKFAAIADGRDIKAQYNAEGSPYYYIIDQTGLIQHASFGYNETVESSLADLITGVIK